ncbi:MAG: FGGY-family carbohydrate kinase [Alphaproteobacteria bacterium]
MSRDLIVGVDAGTSVIKAVAFDVAGAQLAMAARPNVYERLADGGCQQDMAQTWATTAAVLRDLGEKLPGLAGRILVLAVTGQGDGTWLIDAAGEPVAPGWLWLDSRAAAFVDAYRAGPDDRRRYLLTGTGITACQQGAQLAYMTRAMPALPQRAATGFHCKDWLYFKLTGRRATDPTEGVFTFGDFRARAYSDEVVDLLGLSAHRRLLPEIVDGTRTHHALSESAAAAVGLAAGTPVALGYIDVICTALGGGLYEPGRQVGTTVIGSTGMHMVLQHGADAVPLNDDNSGYTTCFPVPGTYAQMQSNMAATLNIDWLLDLAIDILGRAGVSRDRAGLLAGLDDLVLAARSGEIVYQPYISDAGERGPFIDANARAGLIGLNSGHGFADLMRAVFDGLAMASRDCYAAMGAQPEEIRVSGGAARSAALRRILAAALNAPVRSGGREEAGAAGAAMIAAVGIGAYPSMDECVAAWIAPHLGGLDRPDPELAAVYDRLYPIYVQSHRALTPVWRALASARRPA